MKCPFCFYEESKVIDSRPTDEGERIRRRRECLKCGKRFTTYEIIETVPVIVIKRDKSRQVFDRSKILSGLLRACEKRPVSIETLEKIVDEMEFTLQNSPDREVPSERIGELAMEKLKDNGLWICGTDIDAKNYYYNQDLKGPLGIVIGNEGQGMSEKVKKNCDFLVKIPMKGKVTSLNASVSTGIVVYEAVKQRM